MHEMALMQSVIDLIDEQATSTPFERVTKVILSIGALGHVEARALRFGFDVVSRGTRAEAADLVIEELPGQARCFDCGATVEVLSREEPCPACGGSKLLVLGGDEMKLKELEVV